MGRVQPGKPSSPPTNHAQTERVAIRTAQSPHALCSGAGKATRIRLHFLSRSTGMFGAADFPESSRWVSDGNPGSALVMSIWKKPDAGVHHNLVQMGRKAPSDGSKVRRMETYPSSTAEGGGSKCSEATQGSCFCVHNVTAAHDGQRSERE